MTIRDTKEVLAMRIQAAKDRLDRVIADLDDYDNYEGRSPELDDMREELSKISALLVLKQDTHKIEPPEGWRKPTYAVGAVFIIDVPHIGQYLMRKVRKQDKVFQLFFDGQRTSYTGSPADLAKIVTRIATTVKPGETHA